MKTLWRSFCLIATFLVTMGPACAANFALGPVTLANGGGLSAGGHYRANYTVGQPVIGDASGGRYTFRAGFWSLVAVVPTPGAPTLAVERVGNQIVLTWPVATGSFTLQFTTQVEVSDSWADSSLPIVQVGDRNTVSMPAQGGRMFFRLRESTP